jgi:hypothetical protein
MVEMSRLARFAAVKNYALYYGAGREDELAGFDLAVVEPSGQNDMSLREIKNAGALVLAYLSVMEISPDAPEIKLLKGGDFISAEGRPLTNEEYGNYLVDLRSRRWTGLLMHKAGSLITRSGYDGLFLDTIGNVEAVDVQYKEELFTAAVNIVRQLRYFYPDFILVQNWGLNRLCYLTAGYINGICWENPPFAILSCRPWTESVIRRLEKLKNEYSIKVLLLLEEKGEGCSGAGRAETDDGYRLARKIAERRGFILYRAPYRYIGAVNQP